MQPWLEGVRDWRRRDSQHVYALRWCKACEFGQVDPRPAPEELAAAYDMDEYYTHGSVEEEPPHSFFDKLRRHLAWRFDAGSDVADAFDSLPPRQSICEIGCGSAGYLAQLQAMGHDTLGIEPDPRAREAARKQGVQVVEGTGECLPEGLGPFDVVILNHVLEHCLDPARVLLNAEAMLKQGGRLYVEVPNHGSHGARLAGDSWLHLDVPRHVNFFTRKSLLKLCEQLGLVVGDVSYNGYTRQFDNHILDTEADIAEVLGKRRPHKRLGAWALLGCTLLASPTRKYDSVRICVNGRGERVAARPSSPKPVVMSSGRRSQPVS
jgi:SAM-dependent methyltransferase